MAAKPKENELSRKQRKTQEYIKSLEQKKKDGTLGGAATTAEPIPAKEEETP